MTGRFRPLESRARLAVIRLIAVIITDGIAIGSDGLEIRLMTRLVGGDDISPSALDSNDTRQGVSALVVVAALVVSAVPPLVLATETDRE